MATRKTSKSPQKENRKTGVADKGETHLRPSAVDQRQPASLGRFDHVAIEVAAFEATVDELVATGSMRHIRSGVLARTGQRIALLGDGTGVKIELIENKDASAPRLAHLAFRCADVVNSKQSLEVQGWRGLFGPHTLDAAKADTALLEDAQHLRLQIIRYDDTSPDLIEWQNV